MLSSIQSQVKGSFELLIDFVPCSWPLFIALYGCFLEYESLLLAWVHFADVESLHHPVKLSYIFGSK